jgi:hypothetical protein
MDRAVTRDPSPQTKLAYQSAVPDALAPGERLIWEDHPQPPPPRPKQPLLAAFAILVLPTATAILAAIGTHGNVLVVTIATLVMAGLSVFAVFRFARVESRQRKELERVRYRITNRRVMRWDQRGGRKAHREVRIADVEYISAKTMRGGPSEISISGLWFPDAPQPADAIVRRVLDLCRESASQRRAGRRRTGHTSMQPALPINDSPLPPGIVLAPDEHVLWTARPRVHDPIDWPWVRTRLKTLAWLLLPAALLLSSLGMLPIWLPRAHWWTGGIGILWLTVGLYHLLVEPVQKSRRRARSTYVLTNVRAIIHEAGRRTVTRSYLLDMIHQVTVEQTGNGASDVWIGTTLPRIPDADAERLQSIALDAVRAAGGAPAQTAT